MDNYLQLKEIPIAVNIERERICTRCGRVFEPPCDSKPRTAPSYRCKDCLTSKSMLQDVFYSTCTLS